MREYIHCPMCNRKLYLRVCKSAAGYYIGRWCLTDGPYSRESKYYVSEGEAEKNLREGTYEPRRTV